MKRDQPTSLGYALLGLVHKQPQSGYDLRKVFETTPLGHYSSSPGAIYPALKRLEQKAWVEGEVIDGETLRPKRIYRATSSGVDRLRSWVSQDITREDVMRRDEELMLRFAFMGTVVEDTVTRRFLEQMLEILETYIPELQRALDEIPEVGPPHGRLALMSGIESYKARRRWARSALQVFTNDASSRKGRRAT